MGHFEVVPHRVVSRSAIQKEPLSGWQICLRGSRNRTMCVVGKTGAKWAYFYLMDHNFANFGRTEKSNMHIQTTASAPSHPIQHPTAAEIPPMTPAGLVMAGCWQINSILTNIGRRNSIRILNQYPFFWNILIWTQFISFINLFAFKKFELL